MVLANVKIIQGISVEKRRKNGAIAYLREGYPLGISLSQPS